VKAVPFVIAASHHCQLLAQGKHLEMERGSAPQEVHQGGEQRDKYRFHNGNATWAATEKSTKSMSKVFLVGTGRLPKNTLGSNAINRGIRLTTRVSFR
jgi:hypothetical protein